MSEEGSLELKSIILVTSGTRGDRLLFKYPWERHEATDAGKATVKNPYAVKITEDISRRKDHITTKQGLLTGLNDETLALLLGVKSSLLCGKVFDLKIEDVRFVGFPLLLDDVPDSGKTGHQILSFNIAFVLEASHGPWIVSCYQDLAKQLSVALKHEEKRCQYLSTQAKIMTKEHEEVPSLPEDMLTSPYETIIQKSELGRQLQQIYDSLNSHGLAHFYVNHWIEINFCLPHKLHYLQTGYKSSKKQPEFIQKSLKSLRPYHGLLLLQSAMFYGKSPNRVDGYPALSDLLKGCKPVSGESEFKRIIVVLLRVYIRRPLTCSIVMFYLCVVYIFQVFQLVCHLVYWAKAVIIYPLCETNIYVLSPSENDLRSSKLVEDFTQQFPGKSLPVELAEFSFPTQLRQTQTAINHPGSTVRYRHFFNHLHQYVFFVPPVRRRKHKISDETAKVQIVADDWSIFDGGLQRSPSFSDAASVTSDESITLSTPGMLIAQLSKSPSSEFTAESSLQSEENKMYWMMQESVFVKLTAEEKECILNVPAAKNLDDLRMFARLFPYFGGTNHIEEIMYFENLRRSQLITLIEKFKDVLILCTYQDPAA
ncbi:GATOR1 complex protein NPRL3-like [Ruditapes philippinarum]|uniref:GATOR1 complex protein NPRL3-like n=1 Tax=Ruditapes philippinarum TaxID=129788 RepID=UPI00295C2018|nr:GATOR1 complex protein NPRL3-like [Ruditapes philippinarum]